MYRYYALIAPNATKSGILTHVTEAGYKPSSKAIRDVLTFKFHRDTVNLEHEASLLEDYVILKIDDRKLKEICGFLRKAHVGMFFNLNKETGLPFPIPDEEVERFKSQVQLKKDEFQIGQEVEITDGILSGFTGIIKNKKKLMAEVEVKLQHRSVKKWVALPFLQEPRGQQLHND